MMAKSQTSIRLNKGSGLLKLLTLCTLLWLSFMNQVEARDKGGDDIILAKGKIIMRGGKGKGNIILDPGSHSSEESHSMAPMMSLMSHYNPYAFYPMHSQHQPQHHQPPMMIHPIYMEDHSAMQHHQPMEHHEQHHEQHQYQHEEPQHHYEHHDMGHHQEHYEPQHHEPMQHQQQYEQEGSENHDQGGQEEHNGGYEHQGHHQQLMAMMMHGSGPQPAYQQMSAMQAMQQQHPGLYSPIDQQVAAFQAQMAAAAAATNADQQQSGMQSQSTNEVSQSSGTSGTSVETSTKAPNKAIALLEKTAANNPLVQIIKLLFKRNKEQKDQANQQKKS